MRILFLLQEFPLPADNGIRQKVYNIMRTIDPETSYDILAFSENTDQIIRTGASYPHIKSDEVVIFPKPNMFMTVIFFVINFFCMIPPSFARFRSKKMKNEIENMIRKNSYDVIHIDMINMAQYRKCFKRIAVVLSVNDAVSLREKKKSQESHLFRKMYWYFTSLCFRLYEKSKFENFDAVHLVSNADKEELLAISHEHKNLEVIPLSISPEIFERDLNIPLITGNPGYKVLVVGSPVNEGVEAGMLQFEELVVPKLLDKFSGLEIKFLARDASPSFIRKMNMYGNSKIITYVDDYYGEILSNHVVVFPDLSGTGIKTRVLQAMALGVPFVASEAATDGVGLVHGEHCMISRNKSDMVEHLYSVLSDLNLRERLVANSQRLIDDLYSPNAHGFQWDSLYKRISFIHSNVENKSQ